MLIAADCRINPAPAAAAANNAKLALTLQMTKWKWNATQCNKCSATLLVMSLKLTIFTRLNHLDIELQGFIFEILEQACKVSNLNKVIGIQNAMHNMRQLRHSCWSLCWHGEVDTIWHDVSAARWWRDRVYSGKFGKEIMIWS